MPTIYIPSLLRELTSGRETVIVRGATLRQVIESLDADFPGIKDRLCTGDALRSGMMVAIDTEVARLGLAQPVPEGSEVHFLPSISGGSMPISPPPSRSGWFARNWKWLVPSGCLTTLLVCCGGIGIVFTVVLGIVKNTDVYKDALAKAQASPGVIQGLGSPVEAGFMVQGEVKNINGRETANIQIPIKGPKGSGTVHVVAEKFDGNWRYEKLQAFIEGRETPVHILKGE